MLCKLTIRGLESIQASGGDRLFDLAYRLGDLDLARAGIGAIEDCMTAVDAELVVKDLEALGSGLVAAVEDETVGIDDRRWTNIVLIRPEGRAGSGTAGA